MEAIDTTKQMVINTATFEEIHDVVEVDTYNNLVKIRYREMPDQNATEDKYRFEHRCFPAGIRIVSRRR